MSPSGFAFHSAGLRNYSGSAVVPEAGANKALFPAATASSSPFHQWLMGRMYRTGGRSGTSPVTTRNHFLQVLTRITRTGPTEIAACFTVGGRAGNPLQHFA